jgi:hypothetical protein
LRDDHDTTEDRMSAHVPLPPAQPDALCGAMRE